ncbi:hypothetical protein ABH940_000838 [Streptacidiphilus sp. BW17]|uniref:hypothetical protein n=1 Tax=Streptacidiphilus sp. BW17 TaxID=3156274 RepID=UPI0035127242
MYGYAFDENLKHVGGQRGNPLLLLEFTRNDEPGTRRRAEWMRNPAADPAYPPPVAWHLNGGPGFHPPGWHPNARIIITAEVESSLRFNTEQIARKARDSGLSMPDREMPSFAVLPSLPPPPPPPSTIAYPDEPPTP